MPADSPFDAVLHALDQVNPSVQEVPPPAPYPWPQDPGISPDDLSQEPGSVVQGYDPAAETALETGPYAGDE
jgi:hypothetical protein